MVVEGEEKGQGRASTSTMREMMRTVLQPASRLQALELQLLREGLGALLRLHRRARSRQRPRWQTSSPSMMRRLLPLLLLPQVDRGTHLATTLTISRLRLVAVVRLLQLPRPLKPPKLQQHRRTATKAATTFSTSSAGMTSALRHRQPLNSNARNPPRPSRHRCAQPCLPTPPLPLSVADLSSHPSREAQPLLPRRQHPRPPSPLVVSQALTTSGHLRTAVALLVRERQGRRRWLIWPRSRVEWECGVVAVASRQWVVRREGQVRRSRTFSTSSKAAVRAAR